MVLLNICGRREQYGGAVGYVIERPVQAVRSRAAVWAASLLPELVWAGVLTKCHTKLPKVRPEVNF